MKKKLLSFALVLCMLIAFPLSPVCHTEAQAKAKNVTNTIAGKKKVKALVKCFETPCGFDLVSRMKRGETKKYNFSKISARRFVTNYCASSFPKASAKTVSKRLFGKSTSKVKKIIGDWGLAWPEIKIQKIYKLSSAKYRVDAQVLWNDNDTEKTKIGTLKIYLKKKSKSYYGYVATSMTLKKVANL